MQSGRSFRERAFIDGISNQSAGENIWNAKS
jgi:hypothetical protein